VTWNNSHPDQCTAYIEAWKQKDERERAKLAAMQHIIAVSGGVKVNGRAPRFADFFVKEKRKRSPVAAEKIAQFQLNALKRKEEKHGKK
jgi:hypothetical protein